MGNPPTPRLDGLLGEGALDEQQLDALTRWANERARQLVSELDASDHELGALLRGGEAPSRREGSGLLGPLPPVPAASELRSPAPAEHHEPDEPDDGEVEEIDELEVLDEDDVELVDDAGDGDDPSSARTVVTPEPEPEPEWKAALQTAHAASQEPGAERETPSSDAISIRMESEADEISKHDIDLSDLDGDSGNR